MKKAQTYSIIVLFLLLIFGVGIATLFHQDRVYSETENRTLAQMPALKLSSVLDGSFESGYEDYLTDQFILRDNWIAMKTGIERATLHTDSNDVYFADDDYLIEAHTGTFTSDLAGQNLSYLAEFAGIYAPKFGSDHMTVMLVPNAVDIFRDKLPAFASPYDEETYLAEAAEKMPDGIWFDAGAVLSAHSREDLYYKTDHHWKTLAAFYVWQAWAEREGLPVKTADAFTVETVTDTFEGTVQAKLGIHTVTDSIERYVDPDAPDYTVEKDKSGVYEDSLYNEEALQTKSKYDYFFGGNNALTQIRTQAGTGRKILVVKDSYANCFVPFLLSDFDQIDALDIRYYNQELSSLIEEEGYTDLLFLYNASGFAEDTSLGKLLY